MKNQVDVLFVYTNIHGYHSYMYSYSIGYLSGVLRENGFNTALVLVKSKKDYKKVLDAVSRLKPAIVGFSSVSSQFIFACDLASLIRKKHKCIIALQEFRR